MMLLLKIMLPIHTLLLTLLANISYLKHKEVTRGNSSISNFFVSEFVNDFEILSILTYSITQKNAELITNIATAAKKQSATFKKIHLAAGGVCRIAVT